MRMQRGVLVSTDEATVIYLVHLNEQAPAIAKFILKQLDGKTLFVKKERVPFIRKALQARLNATIFDEDEASAIEQAHSL